LTKAERSVNIFASDYQLRNEMCGAGLESETTAARRQRPKDSAITLMSALFIVAAAVRRGTGRTEIAEIENAC
jgi:hypothetical protein